MSKEQKKITRFTIEIVDNGFLVEQYGYNPYGSDLTSKVVRTTSDEVIGDFAAVIARNASIEAAKKEADRKKQKEAEDEI